DQAQYQKIAHQKDAWGGIEGFHFGQDLSKTTSLSVDGRALAGDNDFNLELKLQKEGAWTVDFGYKAFRTWYDGNGGFFPQNDRSFQLYGNDLHIDRSDLWVAASLQLPDQLKLNFRYDFTTRKGLKDSTDWGDTTLTGGFGARAIVPTFLRIDEHRHIFTTKLARDGEKLNWAIDGRYEKSSYDNDREIHRTPGEKTNRYVTQTDAADDDLFMVHGFVERKFTEQLSMSTAVAHYNIDTNISGSRIYGLSYDPVFDPVYASRQYHDEGFYDLSGESTMHQTLANLNVMYRPTETWTFVPALRAEKTTWGVHADYVEAAVGAAPALKMAQDEMGDDSSRSLNSITGTFEGRYTGLKNWVFNFEGEWLHSHGTLAEDLVELETGVPTIGRTTDYAQDQSKYSATGSWYATPGLSFTGQYYYKSHANSYNDTRDNTPDASADRYPGFIAEQNFETNDFNLRAAWRPIGTVRLVSRYDYQASTVHTRGTGLALVESANMVSHIISESATWNPLARWYVQLNGNVVYDQLKTPASTLTGAAAGLVENADNNYVSYGVATGYVISDQTDVSADYNSYKADNYVDNSNRSQPYGATATNDVVGLTLNHRVNAHLNFTVKYTYADYTDLTSGGLNSYRANAIYGRVQYRF
ncbi:MAG TPA: hypothetical protein VG710_15845, partial [Opitutus sp.]|nr:hypothetical protein [Opitutus sp.]